MILQIVLIAVICVVIIDWLNAANEMASTIYSAIVKKDVQVTLRKPFSCSLCMTFWVSLIALLVELPFTWLNLLMAVSAALLAGLSTKYIFYLIKVIDKALSKALVIVSKKLD